MTMYGAVKELVIFLVTLSLIKWKYVDYTGCPVKNGML